MTNLTIIEEVNSLEFVDSLPDKKEELREITEQTHEAYTFYRRSDHAFKLEISDANRNGNQELALALTREMKGYGKP